MLDGLLGCRQGSGQFQDFLDREADSFIEADFFSAAREELVAYVLVSEGRVSGQLGA